MSVMSARKQPRRAGQSSERRRGRAYLKIAEKASVAGNLSRAEQMLSMSDYWMARANCNQDKDWAINGAVMTVTLDRS